MKHYLQLTEEHFTRAVAETARNTARKDAKRSETQDKGTAITPVQNEETGEFLGYCTDVQVPPGGLEPPTL